MSSAVPPDLAHLGLRERKKALTRRAVLEAAERLFDAHGYDGVTVAQIADAANISVKTLFTYFSSKEDLVFGGEDDMRDALVAQVRDRPAGTTPLEAVRAFLAELAGLSAGRDGTATAQGLEGFHRSIGAVPALRPRLLLVFERFEEALADELARETGATAEDLRPRLAAVQLVALLRMLTSPEVRRHIAEQPEDRQAAALLERIDDAAAFLAGGLADYAAATSA